MSTRSLTIFYQTEGSDAQWGGSVPSRAPSGVPLVCLYGHFDGGVNFYGKKLLDFLSKFTIVNGLEDKSKRTSSPTSRSLDRLREKNEEYLVANGIGCLAAQVIAHFKTEAGDFYISPNFIDGDNEDENFIYQVYEKGGKICLTVENEGHKKFLLNDSVGNNGHVSKVVTFMYENDDGTQNRRMLEILQESEDRLSGNDLDRDGYRSFLRKKIIGKIVTMQ